MSSWFLGQFYRFFALVNETLASGHGAPGSGAATVPLTNPLGADDFGEVAEKVIGALTVIATPIVAVMVLVGGFQILTAAGDPEKFSKGKKTILYAAVGFVIILLAQGVVGIINDVFS